MSIQLELSEDEAAVLYTFLIKGDILMEWNLHDQYLLYHETIEEILMRLGGQLELG